jgi:hypothetical protein
MIRSLFALLPVAAAATGLALASRPAPAAPPIAVSPATARVPVVVELFTSEGCSSCPAADAALRELETAQSVPGVEVLALGQHVDYWNRLGWKDPFSSPQFSARQRWYATGFKEGNYTPQAVVNGRYEFVGGQRNTLATTVAQAAQAPRAGVALALASPGSLRVQVGNLPAGTQGANVELAITEAGLASQVGRGENAGRLLHHASVVRTLRTLGAVGADGTFTATVPLDLQPTWKTANLQAVVLVQETGSHHIVGVASLPVLGKASR